VAFLTTKSYFLKGVSFPDFVRTRRRAPPAPQVCVLNLGYTTPHSQQAGK